MKITLIEFMWLVTFIPYLLFAGYSFFVLRNILLGMMFLGLEAFYVLFLKRRIHYETPEEKIMMNAGRLTFAWLFIFLFSSQLCRDTSFSIILLCLGCVPVVSLLVWAGFTKRWNQLLKSRF